jgi:hypothetical protein
MQLFQPLLKFGETRASRLEENDRLRRVLHLSSPAIDGARARQNICAGGQLRRNELLRDRTGNLTSGKVLIASQTSLEIIR